MNIGTEAVLGVSLEVGIPARKPVSFQNRKKQIGPLRLLLRPNLLVPVIQLSRNRQQPTWVMQQDMMTEGGNPTDRRICLSCPQKEGLKCSVETL